MVSYSFGYVRLQLHKAQASEDMLSRKKFNTENYVESEISRRTWILGCAMNISQKNIVELVH